MAVSQNGRSAARPSKIIFILLLCCAGLYFFFTTTTTSTSTGGASTSRQRQKEAAVNPLSPPTKPFFKHVFRDRDHIAPPPVVHYKLNNIAATPNAAHKGQRVLILTPVSRFYPQFWENLRQLTYPHHLISLGFVTPKTREGDQVTSALQKAIYKTQSGPIDERFASVTILREEFASPPISHKPADRHKKENQKLRRQALSYARNSLLFSTLGPSTSWVLWLDSDVVETPPTLLQDMTAHDKPILVPNCYQRYYNPAKNAMDVRPYDYNSWVDSDAAEQLARRMGKDDVLLEGYADIPTYRTLMAHVPSLTPGAHEDSVMHLDGVGGSALLVKADVHRDGAMFPPFPFHHLLETEGFAKIAQRLGWESFGLPHYFVYHYNE